jgi:hypothetical protein
LKDFLRNRLQQLHRCCFDVVIEHLSMLMEY